jgi:folate-dependent phosphoribosylglycinamide formyltransferase PurN
VRPVLTAGFNGALHAVAIAELATRAGHSLAGVLVVSPFQLSRVRQLLRQRGGAALRDAARRLLGRTPAGSSDDAMATYLDARGIADRTLSAWCAAHSVPIHVVPDLNEARSIEILRSLGGDGVLYAGGGILRRPFIEASRGRILNPHSGPLPQIRGMNACEWSLLLGLPPAVTIHVIDEGIDTGGVIERIPIPLEAGDTVESLRAKCVTAGVEGVVRAIPALAEPLPQRSSGPDASRQCFTLAPVLRELLDAKLRMRARPA